MSFTAWSVLIDIGSICGLLLIGKLVRAKVRWVQRLLLPASIIAGVLGLALGPNGAGLIPFSSQLGTYATILTAVVFGALPLTDSFAVRGKIRSARVMWSYSVLSYVLQWGLGLLFAIAVLGWFFDLPDGFGLLLAAGWAGGFGTASAVGGTLSDAGWQEATSLGFTSATVGVVVCIVGGLVLVKWGAKYSLGSAAGVADLPESMRTGLLAAPEEREPIGRATVSPSSLEPLAMQLSLVVIVTLAGYLATKGFALLFPDVSVPVFAAAFLCGLLLRTVIDRTPAREYLDGATIKSISGSATDFLVATGIASIVPSVVAGYAVPLALLMVFGLVYCLLIFRYLTPRMFGEQWLERGLFTWGWSTASIATGLALLRIVDPRLKSGTVEEFGLAYVGFGPVEILLAIVAPIAVVAGFTGSFITATIVFGVALLVLTFVRRWPAAHQRAGTAAAEQQ
ncbi:sodium:glutamate symporter [Saccharopolyspora sp. WRP15-2]|uniref:Sodium:glutamate symporter n=1 Tax=Saccharopolyspora oryzae TaxID=2997343 RepID=A0ABT4UQH0_9PSEU|nr:sodium/glutamate symporter [Saccharopolyspora oryzae]MDA3623970.1 sodium:glutamate symporter [Saccharopolyspora oryzae]